MFKSKKNGRADGQTTKVYFKSYPGTPKLT